MEDLDALTKLLLSKNGTLGCGAMETLRRISETSDAAYAHFDAFVPLLRDKSSLVRNRGLVLIAANARWDTEGRVETVIGEYLAHILDEKPITSRQCIQNLMLIAEAKPALRGRIRDALTAANPDRYAESMRPLVEKDILAALRAIAAMEDEK